MQRNVLRLSFSGEKRYQIEKNIHLNEITISVSCEVLIQVGFSQGKQRVNIIY